MTPTPLPFSTHTLGIGGRIKARYSDFVVEEVLNNGSVCEVTTFLEKGFDAIPTPLKIPPKPEGKDHVHLDLEKINKDFSNIVKRLSRFARVSKKRIGYAGLKDRRGITCQRISIFQPDPELLQKFHIKGVELRNPSWEKERIELGDHSENRFTITIRNSNPKQK
jgi:TruD family tRNA pseudouridine synthase